MRGIAAAAAIGAAVALTAFVRPGGAAAQGVAPLLTPRSGEVVPDRYIVVYREGRAPAAAAAAVALERRAAIAAAGGEVRRSFGTVLNGVSAHLPPAALARVLADPEVAYVEADAVLRLEPLAAVRPLASQKGPPWNLDRVDQRTLPLNEAYGYARTGAGVHVYVIDTGVNASHAEFGGRATRDFDAFGLGGDDCFGHGTHVAGTVGGATYGVAKAARIHGVRVLDCTGAGSTSDVIAGVDWVASNHLSPAVANLSLGGSASASLDTAVVGLIGSGVTVVAAAGNAPPGGNPQNACTVSPARVPAAITVGATGADDVRPFFSNFGPCLDLFAPGVEVTSAWHTGSTAVETLSGTSMAAPHVAGAAALYLQRFPTATPAAVRKGVVNPATSGQVGDEAGSPDRLLYALFTLPSPQSPWGSVGDTTPTFRWSKVYGATRYRFELVSGGEVLYSKLAASTVCGASDCARTPAVVLAPGRYAWRVQALVKGVWRDWSHRLAFTLVP